jgi:hypothetical protein
MANRIAVSSADTFLSRITTQISEKSCVLLSDILATITANGGLLSRDSSLYRLEQPKIL